MSERKTRIKTNSLKEMGIDLIQLGFIVFMFAVLCVILITIPIVLKNPQIYHMLADWLAFTNNMDYKIAYIEIAGSIIGVFVSVLFAVWLHMREQRIKVMEEQKKIEIEQRNHVKCLYDELNSCYEQMKEIIRFIKIQMPLKEMDSQEEMKFICEHLKHHKLYFDENWTKHLAASKELLSVFDISNIYKNYGKIIMINSVLDSDDQEDKKIAFHGISYFINIGNRHIHDNIQVQLDLLEKVFKG